VITKLDAPVVCPIHINAILQPLLAFVSVYFSKVTCGF